MALKGASDGIVLESDAMECEALRRGYGVDRYRRWRWRWRRRRLIFASPVRAGGGARAAVQTRLAVQSAGVSACLVPRVYR